MSSKKKENKQSESWDRIAENYDKAFADEGDYSHRYVIYPALFRAFKNLNIEKKSILELGCGTGTLARKLKKKGADIIAVDYSEKMISYAKNRNHIGNNRYKVLDVTESLPFPKASYDIVLQVMLLHSIQDDGIAKIAGETYRLLNKGGACFVVIPHPFFSRDFRGLSSYRGDTYLTHAKSDFIWNQFNDPNLPPTSFFIRPLSFYINEFTSSGLRVESIVEPKIIKSEKARKEKPNNFDRKREIPGFMMIKFVK